MTEGPRRFLLGGLLLVAACGDDTVPGEAEDDTSGGDESSTGMPTTMTATTTTTTGSTTDEPMSDSSGDESGTTDADTCGNDMIDGDEPCDGADLGGQDCASQGFEGGTLACASDCTFDPRGCTMRSCGNGTIEGNEACDGDQLGGLDCVLAGFDSGTLACDPSCTIYDTSGCGNCGNATLDGDEQCDLADLGGEDCVSQGFTAGELGCAADCTLDTSACSQCGNDTVEGAEVCDGAALGGATCISEGFDGGTLGCAADCSGLDTSACSLTIDCCEANGTPGCNDAACEAIVCDQDAFCCDNQWDLLCSQVAQGACTICGGGTGDCCSANGTNGCDDPACVMDLCGFEGLGLSVDCCESPWDQVCADAASQACTVCLSPNCGNDVVDDPSEVCDGIDVAGQTCALQGFDSGTLACADTCAAFDTSGCGTCGNGLVDGDEVCDGNDVGANSCLGEGFDSGTIACGAGGCDALDTSGCGTCGNGILDGAEACDGVNLGGEDCASLGLVGGTLACTAGCGFDTSACDIQGIPFGSDTFYGGLELPPGAFVCDDISATGTPTGLGDDDAISVPIGFSFTFYGAPFTDATINSNGSVRFGDPAEHSLSNDCLPTALQATTNAIFAFWDDLDPGEPGAEVWYQTLGAPGDQRFVVQWDTPHYPGGPDPIRVQVVLHEASGQVDVCYPDTTTVGDAGNLGAEATAGIQQNGMNGFQYSCNAPDLVDGLLLRYIPL